MDRSGLAASLASAAEVERAVLLQQHASLVDVELARALKALFDASESSDPARALAAAGALEEVAHCAGDQESYALAAWAAGMAAQLDGRMEESLAHLDDAERCFQALGQPQTAAATQVSKLIALAMLGHYDEALACGLRARDVFEAHGDTLAAGKVEQNLGGIYLRRDRYAEAERFYHAARRRFAALADQKQLAQVDNCLAMAMTWQHRFQDAAQMYQQALAGAAAAGLEVTQAEIESNLGNLALFQGRYDSALDYLERARRRYATLGLPHESAQAEQELADAYLELNLAPEAAAIYARVIPTFARLGMRFEQAWALAHYSRANALLGQADQARAQLAESRALFAAEGNAVCEAMVQLSEAQLHFTEQRYERAAAMAELAAAPLAAAELHSWLLLTHWVRAAALAALGRRAEGQALLEATLHDAEQQSLPQIAQRCLTSLGWLAAAMGDARAAEAAFGRAVALVEDLRAPLPAEEFRTAFVADKLSPYAELARLCLADGRVAEALGYVERARARALMDTLGGGLRLQLKPRDSFEAELLARLAEQRAELNWLYSQINRPPDGEAPYSAEVLEELHAAVREREAVIMEITRQIQQRTGSLPAAPFQPEAPFDLAQLQHDLAGETALVEYFSLDGELLAFVVTDAGAEVVRGLGREEQVEALLEQLRFQIDSLRYGAARLRTHLPQLAQRMRHYLAGLYDLLLRPIEPLLEDRRLVVVPHRALYYVPFQALHDGTGYVVERREICYAPSAEVLRYCLAVPPQPLRHALLLGVPDPQIPRVRDEVCAIAPLFAEATALLDASATLAALREQAPAADILHLACHGQFRPDNPLFSSLRLADGWLTVRDACDLDLHCSLVTLSACETGATMIAPGDEMIGLARGFFSAGAPALLVSLWTVDDQSTATFMTSFYTRLKAGAGPAAALRHAQRELLAQHPHPFFWSPFVLFGRW
jgi:tetratricopeptide (TPR) repeat protein